MNKLLLVERTNVLRFRLESLFRKIGYEEVLTYQDSIVPLESFYRTYGPFSSVVIDADSFREELSLIMDFLSQRTQSFSPKIVLLTTSSEINSIVGYLRKGVDDVILMPFNDSTIITKLRIGESALENDDLSFYKNAIKASEPKLVWCTDYQLGVAEIDVEHRDIIDHFAKLYELMKAGQAIDYYGELLDFLDFYVTHHFDHEEALMAQIKYPLYKEHCVLHEDFKNHVQKMMAEYSTSEVKLSDLIKLNLFIKGWLIQHILVEDKKISYSMKEHEMKEAAMKNHEIQ